MNSYLNFIVEKKSWPDIQIWFNTNSQNTTNFGISIIFNTSTSDKMISNCLREHLYWAEISPVKQTPILLSELPKYPAIVTWK